MAVVALVVLQGFVVFASSTSDFTHVHAVDKADVDHDLTLEITAALNTARISELEEELRDVFVALPKDADGHLNHGATFYALHRLFNRRHGWLIKGLEPESFTARNASAGGDGLKSYMKGWVPEYLVSRLEELRPGVQRDGVNLQELAALAATIEDLVREESDGKLTEVYRSLGYDTSSGLTTELLQEVMDTYMYVTLCRGNIKYNSTEHLKTKTGRYFTVKYKEYPKLSAWLRNIEKPYLQLPDANLGLNFSSMSEIAKQVGNDYAAFNEDDCMDLKSMFTELEDRSGKVGRVRLPDFYNKSLYSRWKLNERVEYLRALGTLDESNPSVPTIITANYINARSNCLEVSSVHAVCCRNECEDLMTHLEHKIAAPTADPALITELVSNLPSDTVQAPRELSDALRERLGQVAATNGGFVHLHGRLFAQWMHHAYPRECPFPHEAGAISPQDASDWLEGNGGSQTLSDAELKTVVESDQCAATGPCEQSDSVELPWSATEELLSSHSQERSSRRRPVDGDDNDSWSWMGVLVLLPFLAAIAARVFTSLSNSKRIMVPKKFIVPLTVLAACLGACIAFIDQTVFAFMMVGGIGQTLMGAKQVQLAFFKKVKDDRDDYAERSFV